MGSASTSRDFGLFRRNEKQEKNLSRARGQAIEPRRTAGDRGEARAAEYLEQLGYSMIERNWRCRAGELDIVCIDPTAADGSKTLVVVEVKARRGDSEAARRHLFDTVTERKRRKLRLLTELYLRSRHRLQPGRYNPYGIAWVRIDVIGVIFSAEGEDAYFQHLRGAV